MNDKDITYNTISHPSRDLCASSNRSSGSRTGIHKLRACWCFAREITNPLESIPLGKTAKRQCERYSDIWKGRSKEKNHSRTLCWPGNREARNIQVTPKGTRTSFVERNVWLVVNKQLNHSDDYILTLNFIVFVILLNEVARPKVVDHCCLAVLEKGFAGKGSFHLFEPLSKTKRWY